MQTVIEYGGVLWEVEYDFEEEEPCRVFEHGVPMEPSYPASVTAYSIGIGGENLIDLLSDSTIDVIEDAILQMEAA